MSEEIKRRAWIDGNLTTNAAIERLLGGVLLEQVELW